MESVVVPRHLALQHVPYICGWFRPKSPFSNTLFVYNEAATYLSSVISYHIYRAIWYIHQVLVFFSIIWLPNFYPWIEYFHLRDDPVVSSVILVPSSPKSSLIFLMDHSSERVASIRMQYSISGFLFLNTLN
jgi:hypothetical protein